MLQSDTLREGEKKLETKFIFPIDRDRDNVVLGLPRRRPSSKLLTNFLPSISPLEYFRELSRSTRTATRLKRKFFPLFFWSFIHRFRYLPVLNLSILNDTASGETNKEAE